MGAAFYKKIATAQGVGTTGAFKTRSLRHAFLVKRTAAADRTVKILGSLNDVDYTDLGVTFVFDAANLAYKTFEGMVSSIKVDVSGGTTGTYDVWVGGAGP